MAEAEEPLPGRHQTALLKSRAEVTGLLIPNDRAGVVMCHQVLAHDFVKRESVGPGNLNSSIQRLGRGDFGHVSGEGAREDGLKQRRWQSNGLSGGRLISDPPNELKELRRA